MNTILQQLYNGEICLIEQYRPILEEYKAIHQEVGSVEYPFATLNLPSVKTKYCGLTDEQIKTELNSAFHKFLHHTFLQVLLPI